MFAINLTYRQVLSIAREMSEAKAKGTDYGKGVYDAYHDLLSGVYSEAEIEELMTEASE